MTQKIAVAALQMRSGVAPEANLEALAALVAAAAGQGARYVLSPEVTVAFAEDRQGLARVAGPFENNSAIGALGQIARQHKIFLHLGSMAVALEDGRFANRSLLFTPAGEIAASYDKIHLFDATLPGLKAYRESATYRGGEVAVVTEAAGFKLGMSICYDMRFGALYRELAEAGAQVLAIPAAFTVPTGKAHWEVLLRARAIETGCYVMAAAQGGLHENGRSTYGHSMIIDPWGEIIAKIDGDAPGVLMAMIDPDAVTAAREKVPALSNARSFTVKAGASRPG